MWKAERNRALIIAATQIVYRAVRASFPDDLNLKILKRLDISAIVSIVSVSRQKEPQSRRRRDTETPEQVAATKKTSAPVCQERPSLTFQSQAAHPKMQNWLHSF